ncbi:hypothetical protein STFR1_30363 [Bacillus vallismortis]
MMQLKTGPEVCFFINPIKKVGLTYVRIVLKFTTNLKTYQERLRDWTYEARQPAQFVRCYFQQNEIHFER